MALEMTNDGPKVLNWALAFASVPGRATAPRGELVGAYIGCRLRPSALYGVIDASYLAGSAPDWPSAQPRLSAPNVHNTQGTAPIMRQ